MRFITSKRIHLSIGALTIFFLSLLFLIAPLDKVFAIQVDERTAKLMEGAKKEGKMVWYTTVTVEEADKLGKKFHEKYPFIDVATYRTGDQNLLNRILAEAQAKKYMADTVMITGIMGETLKKKGVFTKYLSPERKFYPEGLKDPEGFWTDIYVNLNVLGYNTRLVSSRDVPKSWNDLLDPKWKGNLGMDDKAFFWFANMLKVMGEENGLKYMKRLSDQNIQFRTGRTLNAQLVAAGESSIGIALYNQRVEEMKQAGAPIEWVAIEPIVPEIHPLGLCDHAPHPNAAKLFVDFLLSREGQETIASFYRIPSRIDVDPIVPRLKKGLKILPFDFSIGDDYQRYVKLYREVLMRK